jgi:hypothetical protein
MCDFTTLLLIVFVFVSWLFIHQCVFSTKKTPNKLYNPLGCSLFKFEFCNVFTYWFKIDVLSLMYYHLMHNSKQTIFLVSMIFMFFISYEATWSNQVTMNLWSFCFLLVMKPHEGIKWQWIEHQHLWWTWTPHLSPSSQKVRNFSWET